MSGTYPTTPAPSKLAVRSKHQTYVSTSRSLRTQAAERGGHLWSFELEYSPRTREVFQPVWAFIVAQRGRYEAFTFVPSILGTGLGDIGTSVPLINGSGQTGRSVVTDGWQPGATMKAGDFIRFQGHTKCYMLAADMVADGSGNATLSIEPALYQSPAENEAVIIENVDFQCSFTADVHELDIVPGVHGTITVSLTEVVDG